MRANSHQRQGRPDQQLLMMRSPPDRQWCITHFHSGGAVHRSRKRHAGAEGVVLLKRGAAKALDELQRLRAITASTVTRCHISELPRVRAAAVEI